MIYVDTSGSPRSYPRRGSSAADKPVERIARVEPSHQVRALDRIHARRLAASHGDEVRALLGRLSLIEMAPQVLARALEPFPTSVRTLDALHLAAMEFLRPSGQTVELACYDERLLAAARAMRFGVVVL